MELTIGRYPNLDLASFALFFDMLHIRAYLQENSFEMSHIRVYLQETSLAFFILGYLQEKSFDMSHNRAYLQENSSIVFEDKVRTLDSRMVNGDGDL